MPPFVLRKRHRSPTPPSKPPPRKRPVAKTTKHKKSTSVDALQLDPARGRTVEENQTYLNSLHESSDSSLSEISSDDFEDALPAPAAKRRKLAGDGHVDTADEMEWEDAIDQDTTPTQFTPGPEPSGDLELTLDKGARTALVAFSKEGKKGPSKIERQIRINAHRMHVQFLLFHNLVRNAWACDKEVQQILVRQLPEGVKKEVDRWRFSPGLSNGYEPLAKQPERGKGRARRRGKTAPKERNQREWAPEADPLEEGAPDLSRGDPLLRLLKALSIFWKKKFTITAPGLRKQGYKPLERLEAEVKSHNHGPYDAEQHGERIQGIEHFRKLAKKCEGSRDVGAQLFTALLRGLGLETRLVANIQPIGFGWNKAEEATPQKSKKDEKPPKAQAGLEQDDETAYDSNGDVDAITEQRGTQGPVKANQTKAGTDTTKPAASSPRVARRTRASGGKDAPIDLSDAEGELSSAEDTPLEISDDDDSVVDVTPATLPKSRSAKRFDRDLPFPIYWTEVLSPLTNNYIPVDPIVLSTIANTPELLMSFEPRGASADKAKQVLAYVVAYSADGTAKDVTVRYLKRQVWPGKTKGFRIQVEKVPVYNRRGKVKKYEEYDWFKLVMSGYRRNARSRTVADDVEEQTDLQPVKLQREQKAGEETLQGYKRSAEFVLERHLRREEAILPSAKPVKSFIAGKGDKAQAEPVFLRKDIVVCKTVESWHKDGREIKAGEQPLKYVPMRAVTLIRKREIEEAERDTGEKLKQGLYSKAQTDWIIPPPIRDGKIPKNAFGNMDVYVPTMVPKGAVHIKLKGTAKICRKLEIEYAEACTGFEFGKQRAVPVLTGVVVAVENKDLVVSAWKAEEEERRRKEEGKREKVALDTWKKFLRGMRVLERLREDHGEGDGGGVREEVNPFVNKKRRVAKDSQHTARGTENGDTHDGHMAGGFLHEGHESEEGGGGGGFVMDDHDSASIDGGGFLSGHNEHSDIGGDIDGGGFVLENHDEPGDAPKTKLTNGYHDKNMNLEPSPLSSALNDSFSRASDDETEAHKPAATRKRRTTGSSAHAANAPPKRKAALRTSTAVRSRYFEQDSDDQVDEEDEEVNHVKQVEANSLTTPVNGKVRRGRNRAERTKHGA